MYGGNGELTSAQMVAMGYQGHPAPSPGGVVPYQPATPSMLAEPVRVGGSRTQARADGLAFADVGCVDDASARPWRRLWLAALAGGDAGYGGTRRPGDVPREEHKGQVKEKPLRSFKYLSPSVPLLFFCHPQTQWTRM